MMLMFYMKHSQRTTVMIRAKKAVMHVCKVNTVNSQLSPISTKQYGTVQFRSAKKLLSQAN